jgi:triacylglycerol esterase/lipase EstA (alpha/beta hydrolase family)
MISAFRKDPEIQRRYQFWVFSYPSGYPYPYSAALLRRELDGIARRFPNRKPIILVGHSMGGLICRLMITDARRQDLAQHFRQVTRRHTAQRS